jgi:hypothetical protein
MIPVGFLDRFDEFADERGTDRSKEIRAAYRDHIDDPPDVETVESLNDELDETIPRPAAKVMFDPDLLHRDADFRDERETDRSEEVCAAMTMHLDDPLSVPEVTDSLVAQIRAETDAEPPAGGV